MRTWLWGKLLLDKSVQLREDDVGGLPTNDVVDALLLVVVPDGLEFGEVLVEPNLEGLRVVVRSLEERLAREVVLERDLWGVVLQVVDPARRVYPSVVDPLKDDLGGDAELDDKVDVSAMGLEHGH